MMSGSDTGAALEMCVLDKVIVHLTIRVAELGSLSSGAKMVMKIFVKLVFTNFATNVSLRGAKTQNFPDPVI